MKITRKNALAPLCISGLLALIGFGCKSSGGPANGLSTKNEAIWYITADIERMNPFLSSDESASYVQGEIWETLTGANPRTLEDIPLLASIPEESPDHLTYTYTIDPKAHWSDGQPVTTDDIIFTYKVVMNPRLINSQAQRGYFVTLDSAWVSAPGKVSFHWAKFRYDIVHITSYVKVVPKHVFDPNNLTDKMSWADLHNSESQNPAIQEFATWFESDKISRDPKYLIGSGPYKFETWITNDRVIVRRDSAYWAKDRPWLDSYTDRIVFKTIKDLNAGLTALKAKDVDIDENLSAPQYLEQIDTNKFKYLKKDTVYLNLYTYLGWNNIRPIFKDKNVRKALTMLINRDEIIHSLLHDMTKKVEGPVAPSQPNFDPTVKQPAFDLAAAQKLLADNGWKAGPDGILEKVIDGKKTPFKFTFMIPSGSDVPKQICLIIANQLKKAGIEAEVTQIEWSVYLEETKSHKFDAMLGSWIGNTSEDEISQLWESSQSKNKGSNHYSYNNPEADALMEAIKVEPDKAKRFEMSHKLQHMIVDDQPVTFMYSSPIRIGWVDRFDNFELFHARPPFDPRYWIVRGAGITRNPNGIPMSLGPIKAAQPQ